MPAESPEFHRFTVLAEYCQFYLQDVQAHEQWMRSHWTDPDLPPGGWTREAAQVYLMGVEPHSLSVGTVRDDLVDTTLRIHPAEPQSLVEDAEHVVEADVDLPNGDMAVCSVADEQWHISLAPGRYRVRVSHVLSRLAEPDDTGYGDYFIYEVDLWPSSEPAPLVVLKQGRFSEPRLGEGDTMPRIGRQDGEPLVVDLRDQVIDTPSQLWDALAAPCGLPEWFGRNLDAWNDTFNGGISAVLDEHSMLIIKVSGRGMFSPGNKDGQTFISVTTAWDRADVQVVDSPPTAHA